MRLKRRGISVLAGVFSFFAGMTISCQTNSSAPVEVSEILLDTLEQSEVDPLYETARFMTTQQKSLDSIELALQELYEAQENI